MRSNDVYTVIRSTVVRVVITILCRPCSKYHINSSRSLRRRAALQRSINDERLLSEDRLLNFCGIASENVIFCIWRFPVPPPKKTGGEKISGIPHGVAAPVRRLLSGQKINLWARASFSAGGFFARGERKTSGPRLFFVYFCRGTAFFYNAFFLYRDRALGVELLARALVS